MAPDEDLQYPIGKENEQEEYESDFNEQLKITLLADIKMLPVALENAIQNLDADQLETPYRQGGWTVKQLVHHVADSHINAYTRFKLGLTEETPAIKPYDQNAWADLSDTQKLPINISLTLLHALHSIWYQVLSDLDEKQWQRSIYHPGSKTTITLWHLLKSYAWHSRHHTAQIIKLRERMNWY
ncbi:MAG: putative metal-dependent hydrolase [Bacteroidota bacterium]|nr:putative metal-dependent hydrolase [Bacteroidota bacterium]